MGSISFLLFMVCKVIVILVPLSLFLSREIFFIIPPCFIHGPCQTSSRPMSGRLYNMVTCFSTLLFNQEYILLKTHASNLFIAPLSGSQGFA